MRVLYITFFFFFFFFSAKTRDGVQEAFDELVHKVLQTPALYTVDAPKDSFNVNTSQANYNEESWCGGSCNLT